MKFIKKFTPALILVLIPFLATGQQTEDAPLDLPKNEIKVNVLSSIFGLYTAGYERILNSESSVGITVAFASDSGSSLIAFTPNYRLYFGKKNAAGFYLDGSLGIFNGGSETAAAIGLAIGTKILTKRNTTFEILAGVGRFLADFNPDNDGLNISGLVYPRLGLSVGKRF